MKSNKQIIVELVDYLLQQDPNTVAYICAGLMVDMNRMHNYDRLDKEEQECLDYRIKCNARQLQDFAKNGPRNRLKAVVMNTKENS